MGFARSNTLAQGGLHLDWRGSGGTILLYGAQDASKDCYHGAPAGCLAPQVKTGSCSGALALRPLTLPPNSGVLAGWNREENPGEGRARLPD